MPRTVGCSWLDLPAILVSVCRGINHRINPHNDVGMPLAEPSAIDLSRSDVLTVENAEARNVGVVLKPRAVPHWRDSSINLLATARMTIRWVRLVNASKGTRLMRSILPSTN